MLGWAEIPPDRVEQVFFRPRNVIHTTRSRWLVGLVLDFDLYEKHLAYVNSTLVKALNISNDAQNYFKSSLNGHANDKLKKSYYQIIQSQTNELLALQKLHDKNNIDFNEIKGIGHSELEKSEANRQDKPSRPKRSVGIGLGIVSGIFSGIAYFETQKLKREVDNLRSNQQVIRNVLKESLSLINVTRMEVEENRHAINRIIDEMGALVETFKKHYEDLSKSLGSLQSFVIAQAQIQTNLGSIRDLITAETAMIVDLHAKVSKLSTQRLSPNILPAPELVRILKSIDVHLPQQLMLPRDPRSKPWYYYTILKTSTIALENQLIVAVEIPLLDVTSKFHVKEAISLPVPYGKTNITAEYELEFKHFAVSTDGRQYVIFTLEDQINCGKPDVNFCAMTSAVYETNHHQYCTLALFQKDFKKIQRLCKIRVTNKLKLPLARYVSHGEWLVAANQEFHLRKLCGKTESKGKMIVSPPFNIIKLESGCRALADQLELPMYFEERSEHQIEREGRITTPIQRNLTNLPIWQSFEIHHLDVNFDLEKLPPIDSKPIDEFVQMLEDIKYQGRYQFSFSNMPYIVIAIVVLFIVILVGVMCLKRQLIMKLITGNVLENLPAASSSFKEQTIVPKSMYKQRDPPTDKPSSTLSGAADKGELESMVVHNSGFQFDEQ